MPPEKTTQGRPIPNSLFIPQAHQACVPPRVRESPSDQTHWRSPIKAAGQRPHAIAQQTDRKLTKTLVFFELFIQKAKPFGWFSEPNRKPRLKCLTLKKADTMSIIDNRKAFHDYFIEERFEAGLVLEGWEVKAIRAGRAQLKEAYVVILQGELALIGAHISPLATASTHIKPDPTRTRTLLMHTNEISRLIGQVERAGYTLIPLDLHYTRGRIKLALGLAKGKKQHDKRDTEREREWQREKQRLLRNKRG